MSSMTVIVNGKKVDTTGGATLLAVLGENGIMENTDGVAVAINSIVVPRSKWNDVRLSDGDSIEVIHAVQGG
jgi:sulfur carrier protein